MNLINEEEQLRILEYQEKIKKRKDLNTNIPGYIIPIVKETKKEIITTYKVDITRLIDSIYTINKIKVVNAGKAYLPFTYENNYYKNLDINRLKTLINNYLPHKIGSSLNINSAKIINEIAEKITLVDKTILFSEMNPALMIRFNDCIYDIQKNIKINHTDKIYNTFKIDMNSSVIKDNIETPIFDKFLNDLINIEDQKCILEFIGAIFCNYPITLSKKALLLEGPHHCGKSKLKNLVIDIIGTDYFDGTDLYTYENDKHATSNIVGKVLIGSGDSKYMRSEEMNIFKSISGGDPISINPKFEQSYNYVYTGNVWITANKAPLFGGDTEREVYNRFIYLKCNPALPENQRRKTLYQELQTEKQGIVSKCIKNFIDTKKNNYNFSISKNVEVNLNLYDLRNNDTKQFINEYLFKIIDKSKKYIEITKMNLYDIYKKSLGKHYLKKKEFYEEVAKTYNLETKKNDTRIVFINFSITKECIIEFGFQYYGDLKNYDNKFTNDPNFNQELSYVQDEKEGKDLENVLPFGSKKASKQN